jgi:hypothetical protein
MKTYPFYAYTKSTLDNQWHIEVPDSLESGNTVQFHCGLRSAFGPSIGNMNRSLTNICRECDHIVKRELDRERQRLAIFFK